MMLLAKTLAVCSLFFDVFVVSGSGMILHEGRAELRALWQNGARVERFLELHLPSGKDVHSPDQPDGLQSNGDKWVRLPGAKLRERYEARTEEIHSSLDRLAARCRNLGMLYAARSKVDG